MKYHEIGRVYFKDNKLFLLIDGKKHAFPISKISEKLLHATKIEREKYEISPSGYGIHWSLIDEDISIDGLLGITQKPSQKNKKTYSWCIKKTFHSIAHWDNILVEKVPITVI